MLTRDEARRVYDRVGSAQDRSAWYEDPPVERLVEAGDFRRARSVLEIGPGTGRVAARLLTEVLPEDARYVGVDISPVMVELATERLRSWQQRAEVRLVDGTPPLDVEAGTVDRVLSTYVLDLLPAADIDALLAEAHRVLDPGGLLCAASLTHGSGPLSRAVSLAVQCVHAVRPTLVGGCRPLRLLEHLDPARFSPIHHEVVTTRVLSSEVLVAERP